MKDSFPFNSVEGFLSSEDRLALKSLAERQCSVFGSFAEIGSYKGLSALCILSGATQPKYLHSFDWFESEKFREFIDNTEAFRRWIITWRGDFKDAHIDHSARFAFVFVDHTHNLEDTRAAYDMFWPHLTVGGVMAFHDYNSPLYPEPKEFLDSLPHKRILQTSILAFEKELP